MVTDSILDHFPDFFKFSKKDKKEVYHWNIGKNICSSSKLYAYNNAHFEKCGIYTIYMPGRHPEISNDKLQ